MTAQHKPDYDVYSEIEKKYSENAAKYPLRSFAIAEQIEFYKL